MWQQYRVRLTAGIAVLTVLALLLPRSGRHRTAAPPAAVPLTRGALVAEVVGDAYRIGPFRHPRAVSPNPAWMSTMHWPTTIRHRDRSWSGWMPMRLASLTPARHVRPDVARWLRRRPQHGAQQILLLGDSEAGGLFRDLNDYAVANGHTLDVVFTWFSATSLNFGRAARIDTILLRHRPTMIIFVAGMNELYARDLAQRTDAAEQFLAKFDGIPYLWVGPANVAPDRGINAVFEQTAEPGRFMYSAPLPLSRDSDGLHPDQRGYRIWMDSIAAFIRRHDVDRVRFDPPSRRGLRFSGRLIMANAAKERGY
jgi:hypothetical protein